jgi:hypothetical protein
MSQRQKVSVSKRSLGSTQESYPYHQPPGLPSPYIPGQIATYGPSPSATRGPNPTSTYAPSPPPSYGPIPPVSYGPSLPGSYDPSPPGSYGPSPPGSYIEYHAMGMQFPMHCYGPMPPMAYAPYSMYPPVGFPLHPFPAQVGGNISDTPMEESDREGRFETILVESDSDDTELPSISTRRRSNSIDSTPEQVSKFPCAKNSILTDQRYRPLQSSGLLRWKRSRTPMLRSSGRPRFSINPSTTSSTGEEKGVSNRPSR